MKAKIKNGYRYSFNYNNKPILKYLTYRMHELSLAQALISQVIVIARKNKIKYIDVITIEAGTLKGIIPAIMKSVFAITKENTLAKDAVLKIIKVKAKAKCRECAKIFVPEINNFLCPKCAAANVEIISGDDLIIKTITGRT